MLDGVLAQTAEWLGSCTENPWVCAFGLSACVIIASLGVPRVILNVTGGAVFGLWSLIIIQPSATIGALLAFVIARYLLADRLRRAVKSRPLLNAISESIDWKVVALTRLASPIPSPLASYLFGSTKVSVVHYALATFICTLPQNLLQIYVGATGRVILLDGFTSPLQLWWMITGLICLAATTLLIAARSRSLLQQIAVVDGGSKL